jgi:hypothetical protein
VFVERVDVVCGVGYDRAAALRPDAARFHEIRRVVTDLAVLDFATSDHRMRLASVHPGVSVEDVVAATGFELAIDGRRAGDPGAGRRRPRTCWHARPGRLRRTRGGARTRGEVAVTDSTRQDPFRGTGSGRVLLHVRVRYPIVQTGMGWVSGPELTSATCEAGGLGILAAATLDHQEMVAAPEGPPRTAAPFGVNLRPDQPDLPSGSTRWPRPACR